MPYNTTLACTKALSDTVFNLSFGFRPERVPILTEVEEAEYADLIAQMWTLVPDYYFGLLEPERFSELQGVMLGKQGTEMQIPVVGISLITVIANELGGRVAAAAGNSSAGIEGHRTPDIPARLFHVTGVASRSMIGDPALVDIGKQEEYNYLTLGNAPTGLESTFVPDPSGSIIVPPLTCYSNFGSLNEPDFDLFYPGKIVPGGNGYTEESSCVPSLSVCAAGNCLISTIYDPVRETYDFIYWAGTSFATPLYAGMVASGGAP